MAEVVVEMTLELVATLPATMLGEEVDLTGVLTDTLFGSTIFDAWTAANEASRSVTERYGFSSFAQLRRRQVGAIFIHLLPSVAMARMKHGLLASVPSSCDRWISMTKALIGFSEKHMNLRPGSLTRMSCSTESFLRLGT